jgi:hypothetical protein
MRSVEKRRTSLQSAWRDRPRKARRLAALAKCRTARQPSQRIAYQYRDCPSVPIPTREERLSCLNQCCSRNCCQWKTPRNLPSSRRPVAQLLLNGHTPARKRPLATGSKGSMRGIGPTCAAVRNVFEIGPVLNPSMERAAPYPDSYTRRSMIRKTHSARFPPAATGFPIALGFIATCWGLTWAR